MTSETLSAEEDLHHVEANLKRLFRLVSESLETVEEAMINGRSVDLSANTSLAEHLKDTIYTEALFFIAKWQPLGRELLYVEALIKVSYDLFRITRYANEIALTLALVEGMRVRGEVVEVTRRARRMVSLAFDALMNKKRDEARQIEELDVNIDRAYRGFLRGIASRESVDREEALEAIILRQLERVADHATYIAREVMRILSR